MTYFEADGQEGWRRVIVFPLKMKALGVEELLRADGGSDRKKQ